MDVFPDDPLVDAAATTVASSRVPGGRLGLILGLPGFGKTSLLAAAARAAAHDLGGRIVWLSGSIVANERHLLRLLPREFHSRVGGEPTFDEEKRNGASVLAIDDIDALVFKRARVADLLTRLLADDPNLRMLASCHSAAAERFLSPNGWLKHLARKSVSPIGIVSIAPLDDDAARALIRRREPRLSEIAAERIIGAAGGHPAALVFLSRLAQLREPTGIREATTAPSHLSMVQPEIAVTENTVDDLITWAAEFAGAVYAESWAALGPQQRAVLWQLARCGSPTSASNIAVRLDLPPSHVSSQLTRLVADGLVRRTETRGQFGVAPLLAKWIGRRAARDEVAALADALVQQRPQPHHAPGSGQSRQQRGNSSEGVASIKRRSTRLKTPPTGARRNGPPIR